MAMMPNRLDELVGRDDREELRSRRVVAVPQEAPVLEVIRLMAEHHIGSVLVMRASELMGIATERDYARKVILLGRSSRAPRASW